MSVLKLCCALTVLFVLASSTLVVGALAVDRESATLAVERAETETVSAYRAVLDAEQAGANVSGLLVRLNDAGEHLAEAEIAYGLGDFEAAINFANVCLEISRAVKIEADELRLEASGPRYMDVWFRMIGSIFGMTVVGFGSFWAWRIFKKRYYRRVLETKPEVVSGES